MRRGTDNDTKHPKCLIKCCFRDLRKAMKARIVETLERVGSPTLILDDVKVVDKTKHAAMHMPLTATRIRRLTRMR